MKYATDKTKRRRDIQIKYNQIHGITPKTIVKEIRDLISNLDDKEHKKQTKKMTKKEKIDMIQKIEKEMQEAAKELDFERAMELRDILFEMKGEL